MRVINTSTLVSTVLVPISSPPSPSSPLPLPALVTLHTQRRTHVRAHLCLPLSQHPILRRLLDLLQFLRMGRGLCFLSSSSLLEVLGGFFESSLRELQNQNEETKGSLDTCVFVRVIYLSSFKFLF